MEEVDIRMSLNEHEDEIFEVANTALVDTDPLYSNSSQHTKKRGPPISTVRSSGSPMHIDTPTATDEPPHKGKKRP